MKYTTKEAKNILSQDVKEISFWETLGCEPFASDSCMTCEPGTCCWQDVGVGGGGGDIDSTQRSGSFVAKYRHRDAGQAVSSRTGAETSSGIQHYIVPGNDTVSPSRVALVRTDVSERSASIISDKNR
jgi:hypothetical protein